MRAEIEDREKNMCDSPFGLYTLRRVVVHHEDERYDDPVGIGNKLQSYREHNRGWQTRYCDRRKLVPHQNSSCVCHLYYQHCSASWHVVGLNCGLLVVPFLGDTTPCIRHNKVPKNISDTQIYLVTWFIFLVIFCYSFLINCFFKLSSFGFVNIN